MRVSISLPDAVYTAAEQLAKELCLPRSQLYAQAIAQYIERHAGPAVTAKLNRVHAGQDSKVPTAFARAQAASFDHEGW